MKNSSKPFIALKQTSGDIKQMLLERQKDRKIIDRRNRMNEILNNKVLNSSNKLKVNDNDKDIEMDDINNEEQIQYDLINTENFDLYDFDKKLDNLNDQYISVCPICRGPAVSFKEFVSCINLCFEFKIKQELLNDH